MIKGTNKTMFLFTFEQKVDELTIILQPKNPVASPSTGEAFVMQNLSIELKAHSMPLFRTRWCNTYVR